MHSPVIGTRRFTDGVTRSVHQAEDGRQFVFDDDGAEVFGLWLLTEDALELAPLVVKAMPRAAEEP